MSKNNKLDDKKILVTKSGYKKLKAEYDDLVNVQRPAIVNDISAAREMGDLRENGYYTASREKQSFIEGRILELEELLKNAEIVETTDDGTVGLDCKVKVRVVDNELVYHIVSPEEVDFEKNKISHESPLGKALMGKKVGDSVEFEAPVGKVTYKIIEIN